ncbi:conserved hypothetical protein [Gloeothece citriformis PCC 7424]|uniref:Xylose isomerase domain protein TIM barrel n=1 Tax=Gloeothece citriformis (strain PCC 7424) TaxID=65393 RepID=B7KHL5_GLOC7|nr:metabolite traffic protein EboE [Gloeothece citriformis]ACK70710.1 conserved hypothetical protein [Gloeothece citriformis PCC 7424]
MRVGKNNQFHLTYCTNIHPGETWEEVFQQLKKHIPPLKTRLSPQEDFGIGLRLADIAAKELLEADHLSQFQSWLSQNHLYVFTLNGFPFGGFHDQIVKEQVYAPDWSKRSRLAYTLRLIEILAALLPEGIEGSISTLPLSYKPWWSKYKSSSETILKESSFNLAFLTSEMVEIRNKTGKLIHVSLEPEPDGLIENTAELIYFFQNWLLPIGGEYLALRLKISQSNAETLLKNHIRLCYDTCHFAVEYEQPDLVIKHCQEAGIKLGKIQLSTAIQVQLNSEKREKIKERLYPFAESTYLHQVIERWEDGTLHHYHDLSAALPQLEQSQAQEWRIHFHVPLFIRNYQLLQSTQEDLSTVLSLLKDNPICDHLEIETYTWDVLPPEMKLDLLTSIEREYQWVINNEQWTMDNGQ